jgi:PST family polysaccharide transporter
MALQIAIMAVLARLLLPSDFGLIAMVTAVTNIAVMFGSLGLSTATVQRENINTQQISTLFWINVGAGLVVACLVGFSAPLVARFYNEPRLYFITLGIAVTFIFNGLSVQHRALLTRNMRFVALGVVDVVSIACGGIAAILAASFGMGYWSLVIMHVTITAVAAVTTWIVMPWRPGVPGLQSGVRELLGFGGHITVFELINYFSRNTDNILIGRVLGTAPLGFYSRAYSLMMFPVRQLRGPVMAVGLPAMSRLRAHPDRYRNYYMKMLKLLSFLVAPIALFLGGYAGTVVSVVLGPGWHPTARVFAILSITAALQSVSGTAGLVLLSSGHSKRYLRIGAVMGILTVGSFAAGLPWGIQGVAISYTVLNVLSLVPALQVAFRDTPISLKDFFSSIALPYSAAIIMLIGGRLLSKTYESTVDWIFLVISLLLSIVLYFGVFAILPVGRNMLREFWRHAAALTYRPQKAAE